MMSSAQKELEYLETRDESYFEVFIKLLFQFKEISLARALIIITETVRYIAKQFHLKLL